MKRIAIFGSTGSIGSNTLEVIRHFPKDFRVSALSANSNIGILARQIKEFSPRFACVQDSNAAWQLKCNLKSDTKILAGEDGLEAIAREKEIDKIVLSISGSAALAPLLAAIDSGKEIALANKEALVMAGPLVMRRAGQKGIRILPIDSEQSAIWQCLEGRQQNSLRRIFLTASGGPFLRVSRRELKGISVKKVISHPRWKMGKKISVDSATLMNKGLEILEAMFLFGVSADKIKVLIHPEAIIHSMVEFQDGVVIAQLAAADMRIPIQYALSYPKRLANSLPAVDFYRLRELHFEKPDFKKFPCLNLAYRAAQELGVMPAVLNAANEVCVEEFLKRRLEFAAIAPVIEQVMETGRNKNRHPDLADIREADRWARQEARGVIANLN